MWNTWCIQTALYKWEVIITFWQCWFIIGQLGTYLSLHSCKLFKAAVQSKVLCPGFQDGHFSYSSLQGRGSNEKLSLGNLISRMWKALMLNFSILSRGVQSTGNQYNSTSVCHQKVDGICSCLLKYVYSAIGYILQHLKLWSWKAPSPFEYIAIWQGISGPDLAYFIGMTVPPMSLSWRCHKAASLPAVRPL